MEIQNPAAPPASQQALLFPEGKRSKKDFVRLASSLHQVAKPITRRPFRGDGVIGFATNGSTGAKRMKLFCFFFLEKRGPCCPSPAPESQAIPCVAARAEGGDWTRPRRWFNEVA